MGNVLRRRFRADARTEPHYVVPNHTVAEDIKPADHPNNRYRGNKIKTTKYTVLSFIPKNIFEQFHRFANLYFLFIVILNWVPEVNAFGKEVAMIPVLFVLSVTAIKDAFEDYRRYKSDKIVNCLVCSVYNRQERGYVAKLWQDVRVGDVIRLSCNDVIPADMILLRSSGPQGLCHIDTSNLDGENNLKQREIVRGLQQGDEFHPSMFSFHIECEAPNLEIYKFNGAILLHIGEKIPVSRHNVLLRGCIIRNTDFVEGIVVYAGHETKAMLNNRGPRYKRSRLEQQINRDVVWCVIILFLMCFFCSLGSGLFMSSYPDILAVPFIPYEDPKSYDPVYQAFIHFWTYIILFQVMIPLSLYVTIELVKIGQIYFIQNDLDLYHAESNKSVQCRALNITEDLGQIEYIFSDKTGTLTENKMLFKRCTIGGVDYTPPAIEEDSLLTSCITDSSLPSDSSFTEDKPETTTDKVILHPDLWKEVSTMTLSSEDEHQRSPQSLVIWDFFLLLVVCNTVVVSDHIHPDQMHTSVSTYMINNEARDPDVTRDSSLCPGRAKRKIKKHLRKLRSVLSSHHSPLETRGCQPLHNEDIQSEAGTSTSGSMMSENTLKKKYEAESPDELALVRTACSYGCRLLQRTSDCLTIWLPGDGEVSVEVLHTLHFDATRRRMSVIIRHPVTKEIILLCKGADSSIFHILKNNADDEISLLSATTETHLTHYARAGLRTLCMAKKVLSPVEYNLWLEQHREAELALEHRDRLLYESACRIETNLELLGATGIEDRLQEGVPETIGALRQSDINIWVLTGDKQETALNIAYACQLISFDQKLVKLNAKNREKAKSKLHRVLEDLGCRVVCDTVDCNTMNIQQSEVDFANLSRIVQDQDVALIIDGKTLEYILEDCLEDFLTLVQVCSTVVCARATPAQKAEVVKIVQNKLKKQTLAVGDGANDVNMIQTANIGIGISGQEGMQAVMASDFALPRFCFLKRLLLVHGQWSYNRLAKTVLYMFYKNAVFIFMLLWFQLYSGFSGGTFLDDLNLIFFNLVYTSLPPIILGIFDQEAYKRRSYFICIADAVWQSVIEFFVPYLAYYGSNVGMWEFGFTCNAGCVWTTLLHLCIETKYWHIFHWLVLLLSAGMFYGFNLIFYSVCTTCSPPANPYWVPHNSLATATHWFSVVLTITIGLAPRFLVRVAEGTFWPSRYTRSRLMERAVPWNYYASWSSSSSATVSVNRLSQLPDATD